MPRTPVPSASYSAYFKSGLISILWALGAIVILLVLGKTGELLFSSWFQTCIAFSAFLGGHLSGGTYFGRVADLWSFAKTKWSKEFKGTLLAIVAAVTTAITLTVLRAAGHFFIGGVADIAANFIGAVGCVLGTVGVMAGFANRLSADREPKAILLGTILGLGTSLALWFTGSAAMTAVAGVTAFFTGGLALPVWAIGALFVVGYTGANVSAFDYHARAGHYLKYLKTRYIDHDDNAEESIKENFHQYRGSTIGVLAGIVMATIVVVALGIFVTQPWFLAIPIAFGIYYNCTSIFGGICGRMGREIDELIAKNTHPLTPQKGPSEIELANFNCADKTPTIETRPIQPQPAQTLKPTLSSTNILRSLPEKTHRPAACRRVPENVQDYHWIPRTSLGPTGYKNISINKTNLSDANQDPQAFKNTM